jgi:hypothetical protein
MKLQDVILKAMEEDQLAGRGGDHRGVRPDDAPDARSLSEVWLRRADGSAGWRAERATGFVARRVREAYANLRAFSMI